MKTYKQYISDKNKRRIEEEYPANSNETERQSASTNNYPVPATAVLTPEGDKITNFVKDEVEKNKASKKSFKPGIKF